jgi:hypothetical protein
MQDGTKIDTPKASIKSFGDVFVSGDSLPEDAGIPRNKLDALPNIAVNALRTALEAPGDDLLGNNLILEGMGIDEIKTNSDPNLISSSNNSLNEKAPADNTLIHFK